MGRPKRRDYDVKGPFTLDPMKDKIERTVKALKDPRNHPRSNREIASRIGVDESTVRKYRDILGVPKLAQCSGKPLTDTTKKRKRRTRGK